MADQWWDNAIGSYGDLARSLAEREDEARRRATSFLTETFNERGGGYLEDRDIDRMYAGASDQASRARMAAFRSLRANLGARGITGGGYATGLGARVEMERLGNLATQQRSLKQFQAEFNAQHGARRMQGAGAIAGLMNQGPSTLGIEGFGNVIGAQLTRYGISEQSRAADKAAKNARIGGLLGLGGQVLGGGLSLLG